MHEKVLKYAQNSTVVVKMAEKCNHKLSFRGKVLERAIQSSKCVMKGVLFHLWLIIPSAVLAGGRRRACFCGWAVSLHPGVCPVTLCCRLWFMRCFWREMWDDLRRLRPEAAAREEITGHWQVRRDESDALRSCCLLQQDMFTMREDVNRSWHSPREMIQAIHCHLQLQEKLRQFSKMLV